MSINKNNYSIKLSTDSQNSFENSKNSKIIEMPNKLDIETQSTTESNNNNNNNNEFLQTEKNLVYGVDLNVVSPRMLGNTYSFFFRKGNPLVIIGPDYSYNYCMIGTFSFFYWLEFFTIFKNNFKPIVYIESIVYFSFMISYLFTALINPGIPNRYKYYSKNFNNLSPKELKKYSICEKCNITVPKKYNIQHCYDCNICVMELDHHCPWTGKCIGKNNIYSFYIFIISLFLYIFSTMLTFMLFIVFLDKENKKNKGNN